ncbi:MAG TPA: class I SAM-dependent methyltransferase [Thermoflexia bacterium]|nr:class I SAM-dependent methyltransferase [Thermoflexia bacterium]
MIPDYLTDSLNAYWFAPPVALWRAIELRVAAEEEYDSPMLDLGCGDGLIARVLFGAEAQVEAGLDPWMEQLRQAARSGVYRHVELGHGHALPYADGTFATVFSNSVLEHIPNVVPVLCEVRRVLRPDGRFIFTVPSDAFRYFLDGYVQRNKRGDIRGAEAYAAAIDAQLEHHYYYNPGDWRNLLATVRLEVTKTRYYIPEQVERLWDRMNHTYGIGRRFSAWGLLASPRLRFLGYQSLLRRAVARKFSRRWRHYYEMDVPTGKRGGGLLVVARRRKWR